MPRTAAPADRLDLATGATLRTCRTCSVELPLTPENFFHRVERATGETTWVDGRCQTCRRRRDAETRAARRAGRRTSNRKFGVEMETVGATRSAIERELRARGLAVYGDHHGYTHRVVRSWKVVTDGSVMGGYEIVSPPLSGARGLADLKLACEALDAAGARVNRSCGLHVHHDIGDFDGRSLARLFRAWSTNQRATDGLVAASRANSQWARPLTTTDVERIESIPAATAGQAMSRYLSYTDRYRSLNIAAFPRYGTVEVRQHQGTTNYDKIAAWIAFGQAFIAWAKSDAPLTIDATADALVATLVDRGELAADHATYLRGRAAHFARPARRRAAA